MANYNTLKAAIQAVINENHNNEITGTDLQNALVSMINSLGAGYQFMGIATPTTNPGTPDQNVYYLASENGTYANFNSLVISNEVAIFAYNGQWQKIPTGIASEIMLSTEIAKISVGYTFGGVITPFDEPIETDKPVFYIAKEKGIYTNFGGIVKEDDKLTIIMSDGYEHIIIGDNLDLSQTPTSTAINVANIWFQYPVVRTNKITRIDFRVAVAGVTNFYVVTYNEGDTTITDYELIQSVTSTAEEVGTIKTIHVDVTLESNQFIGINGRFGFNNVSSSSLSSRSFVVATSAVAAKQTQDLFFNAIYEQGGASYEIGNDLDLTITPQHSVTTENLTNIWFQQPETRLSHVSKISYRSVKKDATINFYLVTRNDDEIKVDYSFIASAIMGDVGSIGSIGVDVDVARNQYIGINGCFGYAMSNDTIPARLKSNSFPISTKIAASSAWLTQDLFFNISDLVNIEGWHKEVIETSASYDDALSDTSTNAVQNRIIKNALDGKQKNLVPGENITILADGTISANVNGGNTYVKKRALLYNAKLTSQNNDIVGNQSFGSFGLVVDDKKVLNKFYSLADRTIKYVCKFGTTTIAEFNTYALTTDGTRNALFTIDIPNKRVNCLNLEWRSCPILNGNDVFIVAISKHYQNQRIKVINMYSGEVFETTYTNNGTGGVGSGAIGTAYNTTMQWDYYGMNLKEGASYEVSQIIVDGAKADIVIYGDSISEPEQYYPTSDYQSSWTQLFIRAVNGNAVTSGRGGTNINQVLNRIQNEIPFIKPKYVMVTIGTNSGNTKANLEQLVDYIESQGAICILNHIPANINSNNISNHVAVNAVIDQVRASKNVKGVNFDIPTSINHDGVTVDQSQMWKEDYIAQGYVVYHHPNVKGAATMFAQMLIDVPELFI